jgi:Flp pilus assembly protein TadG
VKIIPASCRGNAAVEFGIIAPILSMILVAVIQLGLAVRTYFTVQEAALAGANYASHNGWNATAISTAITTSSNKPGLSASPAPSKFCGCPTTSGLSPATCGTKCTGDGFVARQYAKVSATMARPSVLSANFGLPASITVTMTTKLP